MHDKIKHSLFIPFLIMGCLLSDGTVLAQGGPAKDGKAEEAPEIRRVAVLQEQAGEKLFRSPLSLALDEKNGDLLVTSFEAGEVVILDKDGSLVKRMGGQTGIASPYGIAVDAAGRIYVSEVQSGLLKVFSPAGVLADEINLSRILGRTVSPGRITIGPDGIIYVADLTGNEILLLNSKGDFLKSMGGFEYLQKAGVVNEKTLGLSAMGKAVRVFDKGGAVVLSFGDHTEASHRAFSFPTGFALDSKGRLWIADAFQHRLKVFSMQGELLFNFGRLEESTGGFFFPVDLCFGERGKLFVLEKGAGRIQVFEVKDLKE